MANNEYVNRVDYGDDTLIDISDTTAEAGDVLQGETFYLRSGAPATGTLGDATQSFHGLMSAADKTKLDSINTNAYQEIDVVIAVSDWTVGAPYTYNWTNSAITTSCHVEVVFKTNARGVFNGDISYDKITGGVQFIATEKPTDTINLVVQITESQSSSAQTAPATAGLSASIKNALLDCFSHVAWTTASGQTYYSALADALFGVASISATLNLNEALIRENNTLNDLKQYLTVTALGNDGSVTTLTSNDYTLSGTIGLSTGQYEKSTQTITVTYGGKTNTISVPIYNAMTLDRVNLPSGYTQLTMIQSTVSPESGSVGSYINSGVNGLDIDHAEYGVQAAVTFSKGVNGHILSSRYTWYPYFRRGNSGTQKFQGLYKSHTTTANEINYDWESNTNYVIKAYPTIEINGTVIETYTTEGVSNDTDTYIFARPTLEGIPYDIRPIRLFYLKMYDSQNQLIHNYVPCKNGSNVVGLYDTVAGIFHTSANENYSFTAGEAIQ